MTNYLKSVPIETYQKVLLRLNHEDLKSLCQTDKYVQEICQDNYFNYQYINFNYDSYEYGYSSWEYNKNINWKSILDKVSSPKKILPIRIVTRENIKLDKLAFHKNDTVAEFINRIIRFFNLIYKNEYINYVNIDGDNVNMYYGLSEQNIFLRDNSEFGKLVIDKMPNPVLEIHKIDPYLFDDFDQIGIDAYNIKDFENVVKIRFLPINKDLII